MGCRPVRGYFLFIFSLLCRFVTYQIFAHAIIDVAQHLNGNTLGKVFLSLALALSFIDWIPDAVLGARHAAWGSSPTTNMLILMAATAPLLPVGFYVAAYLALRRDEDLIHNSLFEIESLLIALVGFSAAIALAHISEILIVHVIPSTHAYPVRYSPHNPSATAIIPYINASSDSTSALTQLYQQMETLDLESATREQLQPHTGADAPPETSGSAQEEVITPSSVAFYDSLNSWTMRTNGVSAEIVWISPAYIIFLIITVDCILYISDLDKYVLSLGILDGCLTNRHSNFTPWMMFQLPLLLALLGALTIIKYRHHRKMVGSIAIGILFLVCSVEWMAGYISILTITGSSVVLFFILVRVIDYFHQMGHAWPTRPFFSYFRIFGDYISWPIVLALSWSGWLFRRIPTFYTG